MPQANRTGKRSGGTGAARRAAPAKEGGKPDRRPGDRGEVEIEAVVRSRVEVRADTLSVDDRTVEIIWAAGASVQRYDWWEGEHFIEELSMDPGSIRMGRFAAGMSLLDSHSAYTMDDRLGVVVPGSVRIENGLGIATVQFSRKQRAEELFQDLQDGMPFPVSVGYKIHAYERTDASETSIAKLTATDWEPFELSAVPIPADAAAHSRGQEADTPHSKVVVKRRAGDKTMPQPNQTGRKPGETNNPGGARSEGGVKEDEEENEDGTDADQTQAGNEGQGQDDDAGEEQNQDEQNEARNAPRDRRPAPARQRQNDNDTISRTEAERLAEAVADRRLAADRKRREDIAAIGLRTGMTQEMIDTAVNGATSVDAFRTLAFDAMVERQKENNTFPFSARGNQDEVQTRRDATANAILHRFGFAKELTPAARATGFRDMSTMDIAKELMRERGENVRGSIHQIAERAFHTTSDFPLILAQVTDAVIMQGYATYENTFQLFASRNVVSDFRDVSLLEVGDVPDLLKVNEHGEFKRGTMKESGEKFRIATYGRIIGFTRQMLVNDQLNLFVRAAQDQGRKVAKLEGDVTWATILENIRLSDGVPIFDTSRGNKAATGSALSLDSLKTARTSYRKLKNIDGEPIDVAPRYLFVGTELEINAQVILNGIPQPGTVNQVIPDAIKSITPVYESRLDKLGQYAWLLLADPAQIGGRGIQYAYLAGSETPFQEQRVGFDVDGVEFKVRHDFGAGATDFRFGYLNSGAAPSP